MKNKKLDGRQRNGRKKGETYKKADYILIYNQLHFKKPFKDNGWHKQTHRLHPVCPVCDNDNGEFITELREGFFQCEIKGCKHTWDIEMSR